MSPVLASRVMPPGQLPATSVTGLSPPSTAMLRARSLSFGLGTAEAMSYSLPTLGPMTISSPAVVTTVYSSSARGSGSAFAFVSRVIS